MKVLWPVLDSVCLSFTHRSTIHASAEDALQVGRSMPDGRHFVNRQTARTACGVDAFVVAHAHTDGEYAIVATWPPPSDIRCQSCDEATGTVGKQRKGSYHWQGLSGPDPRVVA